MMLIKIAEELKPHLSDLRNKNSEIGNDWILVKVSCEDPKDFVTQNTILPFNGDNETLNKLIASKKAYLDAAKEIHNDGFLEAAILPKIFQFARMDNDEELFDNSAEQLHNIIDFLAFDGFSEYQTNKMFYIAPEQKAIILIGMSTEESNRVYNTVFGESLD